MRRLPLPVVFAALLTLLLCLFGRALFSDSSFVYRDAAHFYYPLFEWTSRQWSAGMAPFWNPLENNGSPMLGQTSSSLFYPGQLLFALPLDYASRYKLYLVLHVALAAGLTFRVARRWGASYPAAGMAAAAYAFSGNVMFQTCNAVFLVSAAWLPWALENAELAIRKKRWTAALGLAAALALMTLGGDPHTAYHAGLAAALYALFQWGKQVRRRSLSRNFAEGGKYLGLLALAAVGGASLAAVQILPSLAATQGSQRAAFEKPRSLYEIPPYLRRCSDDPQRWENVGKGLLGRPQTGTHHEHAFLFSVGPWRLPELIWPNFSGREFPQNRRWLRITGHEQTSWTPSLYMGLAPLLLGWLGLSWRRGRARWLTWLTALAALATMGGFGVVWWAKEIAHWCGGDGELLADWNDAAGGVYWWLTVCLPKYAYFRFPAKWGVVAALGWSLLAARGLDRLKVGGGGLRTVLIGLGGLSLGGLFGLAVSADRWRELLARLAPTDALFGPFDADGAIADLRIAMLHTAILCGVFLGVLIAGKKRAWIRWSFFLATCWELTIAQAHLAPLAHGLHWREPGYFGRRIQAELDPSAGKPPVRIYRGSHYGWLPSQWSGGVSSQRQREGLQWDRDTLFPKYPMLDGMASAESYGSLSSQDYLNAMLLARAHGPTRADRIGEPHPMWLNALGVEYLSLPPTVRYPRLQWVPPDPRWPAPPVEAVLWRNPDAFPRVWIVHRVKHLPPIDPRDPEASRRRTREALLAKGRFRDLRRGAVIESSAGESSAGEPFAGEPFAGEPSWLKEFAAQDGPRTRSKARIIRWSPQEVEVEASTNVPGLLILSDYFSPGWRAEVRTDKNVRSARIWRTHRVMRGVYLPPGTHRVRFAYQPPGWSWGVRISAAAWIILVGGVGIRWRRGG